MVGLTTHLAVIYYVLYAIFYHILQCVLFFCFYLGLLSTGRIIRCEFFITFFSYFRYLCSCRQASLRAWSTKKILRNVTILIVLCSILVNCPYLVFARYGIDPTTGKTVCAIQNSILLAFNVNIYKTLFFRKTNIMHILLTRHIFKCQ